MPAQPGQGQCPFCQLISNPQQLALVGETNNFYAWLEVNPRARGHTMVVPKEHTENILELSMEEWQEAFKLTREVVEKAKKGLDADGASITVNIEEAGGQMLPHAYIQVFPRFEEEENAGTPTGAIFPQREELQNQLEDIQSSMRNVSVDLGENHEAHPDSQNFKDESKIDRIIDQTDVGNPSKNSEEKTSDEEKERENPKNEPSESREQNQKQAETQNTNEKPSDLTLDDLVEKHGGVEEFLQSREMKSLLSRTNFSLKEERSSYEGKSFEWR